MGNFTNQPGSCCGCSTPNCGPCTIPSTLHLTDDNGTIAITLGSGGSTIWTGCYNWSRSNVASPCDCGSGLPGTAGMVGVLYQVEFAGVSNQCSLTINRLVFSACNNSSPTDCTYFCGGTFDSSCNPIPVNCSGHLITCDDLGGNASFYNDVYGPANLSGCTFPLHITLLLQSFPCADGLSAAVVIDV